MMSLKVIEAMRAKEFRGKRASGRSGTYFGARGARIHGRILSGLLAAVAVVGGMSFEACGGGNSATTVSSVTISPSSANVPINTQFDFTAVVNLKNSTTSPTTTVTWEVNGIAGGNISTVGSIVASTADPLVGVYTAPPTVPTTTTSTTTNGTGVTTQLGQVAITAVTVQDTTTTTTTTTTGTNGTVTSNAVIVTIGAGLGLSLTPTTATVGAGGTQQFTALNNGLADPSIVWTITPAGNASVYGSISATGLYTAPLSPPPTNSITITATDPSITAPVTATVTVTYSDQSLKGQYSFSYTGNDSLGFLAEAGSFFADGSGHILSGVEDVDSFLTGVSTQIALTGTYSIGPDGRGTATIRSALGTDTWQFAIATTQHAQMIRLNVDVAAGGTIDQQSVDALGTSPSAISGAYVFDVLGADVLFKPLGMGGKFSADGAGNVPQSSTILDVNDNGVVTPGDRTLHGAYQFDGVFAGTGRGTLTLTSATTGATPRTYAFYAVDAPASSAGNLITHLRLIEIDGNASAAGEMFGAPAGPATLTAGNYVFTGGGNSSAGAYAAGGVFASDGTSNVTSGVLDINNAGTQTKAATISSCPYSADSVTGRIDLALSTGGSCATSSQFALYQTSQGTALMLELDSSAVATGTAYQQCVVGAAACPTTVSLSGLSFAVGLDGRGIFHNSPGSYQPDTVGQFLGTGMSITSGNLDINNFSAFFSPDAIAPGSSSIVAPASNGRGTAVVAVSAPTATYNLAYYLIDDNRALLLDQDSNRVATGIVALQY